MNPSASGWINKFEQLNFSLPNYISDFNDLYKALRTNGFIYGLSQYTLIELDEEQKLSQDEVEKFNLLISFYFVYKLEHSEDDFGRFIKSVLIFFKKIEVFELSLWDKFIAGKDSKQQLERIIHEHVQIDQNIFTKHFNKNTTNSLLFIDVLGFHHFLKNPTDTLIYVRAIESIIINITNDIFSFKKERKKESKNSIRLITESFYYQKKIDSTINLNYRSLIETKYSNLEKCYFLDIACLTIWEPIFEDDKSYNFINALGIDMNLEPLKIEKAKKNMVSFYTAYKDSSLFKSSNLFSNFYDNTSQLVIKLIKRNSKRILKEITQSKELMVLLTQSTIRDLSQEEQEKVQQQLLDILKTIPSLAIFLLPGGAILLPVFVKLLPNMMPSAFDDNKVDKQT